MHSGRPSENVCRNAVSDDDVTFLDCVEGQSDATNFSAIFLTAAANQRCEGERAA
jgi:hypothetical protein